MIAGHNPFGVLVTLGYLTVALFAWVCAFHHFRARPAGRAIEQTRAIAIAWTLIGLILVALAVLKIGRFEPVITEHFRHLAHVNREYDDRRDGQRIDVIIGMAVALLFSAALLGLLHKAGERALAGLATTLILVTFVGVRMVSLHDIDGILTTSFKGLSVSNVIELVGLAIVALLARSRPGPTRMYAPPKRTSRRFKK